MLFGSAFFQRYLVQFDMESDDGGTYIDRPMAGPLFEIAVALCPIPAEAITP